MKKKRRRLDLRCVRTSICYSVPEVSKLLDVTVGTVRAWLRDSLPSLVGSRPTLIFGAHLKSWLQARQSARKQKCAPDELFCFRCRKPKRPQIGTVKIVPRNQKTLMIKARCSTCGSAMNRAGSVAKIGEIEEIFGDVMMRQAGIVGCDIPSVERDLKKEIVE